MKSRICASVCGLLLFVRVAYSGNGEAIDAFWLTKAREGAKAVYDKYEKVSARLEEECESRADFMSKPSGKTSFQPQTMRERIIRLDENMILERVHIFDANPKRPRTNIECENKDYFFTLSKLSQDDAYVIGKYGSGQGKHHLLQQQKTAGLHNLSFWYLEDILAAINNKNKYSLRKLQFDAGKQLLVIKYNRTQGETLVQNECYLDPSHDWRVVEYRREYPDILATAQFVYGIEIGGVEFPIKYNSLSSSYKGDKAHLNERTTRRLISLKIADKKPEDFRLSAFGIPEPIDAPELPKPTPWYLWVLAAAGSSAALAMLFVWLKRRYTKTSALSPKAS